MTALGSSLIYQASADAPEDHVFGCSSSLFCSRLGRVQEYFSYVSIFDRAVIDSTIGMSLQDDIYVGELPAVLKQPTRTRLIDAGYWIDHSKGSVLGATVTLTTKWGTLLSSAATIAVTIIGATVWTIVAFFLHHSRATNNLRDELDAQIQVVLRNCKTPDTLVLSLLGPEGLASTWHKHTRRAWHRCAAAASAPGLVWLSFLVAGVFVGKIATSTGTNSHMLLKAGDCGWLIPEDPSSTASNLGLAHITVNASVVAMQYARQCYQDDTLSAISCNTWPKKRLPYHVNSSQPCPFTDGTACFDREDGAPITITTSKLDSHSELGVNAPKKDRITLEKRVTCAPLDYDFVDGLTFSNQTNNITFDEYYFGTWRQSDLNRPYLFGYAPAVRDLGLNAVGYSMMSYESQYPHTADAAQWVPISPLNQTAGDLSLILVLPNSVSFTSPVSDVMFQTSAEPNPDLLGGAPYIPLRNVYALSCIEEHQICNPNNDRCTGFQPSANLTSAFGPANDQGEARNQLQINAAQNATAFRIVSAAVSASLFNAVHGVSNSLAAEGYLIQQTMSQALPDGQWKREVQGWFEAALSKLQLFQSVWVDMPRAYVESNAVTIQPIHDSELRRQCHQQRVAANQHYQNYNFFALILIAALALIVPTLSLLLPYLPRLSSAFHHESHGAVSWQAEGLLQLHRMAMEDAGFKGWDKQYAETPRTEHTQIRLPQAEMERDDMGRSVVFYPRAQVTIDDSKGLLND